MVGNNNHIKRIAIIGAGSSGLAAIKCCLDEDLEPICFEKSNDIGGLWNYSDTCEDGRPSIYKSLVINTSKDMMMFSDFPPPEEFPSFLTHAQVLAYFRMYASHFGLLRHIRFNTEVRLVRKSKEYDTSGRWIVESTRGDEQNVVEDFDGVMICSGHHSFPYTPQIPGIENFQGTVIHSHAYKEPTAFHGKRVVILGLGNSASDIACDLAKTSEQVYLSSRRGAWIVPKTAFWGLPADMLANSRVVFTLPMKLLDWFVQKQANFRIDHNTYGLRPHHGVLNSHPTINDELPIHLVSGRVKTKTQIVKVDRDGVWFEDDPKFCPCDTIIMATGYDYRVNFVHQETFQIVNNRTNLYKYMFPPHLPHPTLATIGLVQAIGAVMPIAELQSRWFISLISGRSQLPSRQLMEEDVSKRKAAMDQNYVGSRRHTIQTFWIDYMDQVSWEIGARPNLWQMLLSDPELALKCYLGPCLPSQYRLYGPGTWSGARQFIIDAYFRVNKPKADFRVIHSEKTDRRQETLRQGTTQDAPSQEVNSELLRKGEQHCRASLSPEWTTSLFYVTLMLVCGFVWFMVVLLDLAGDVINQADSTLDNTIGRRMPFTE
ncbi:flavin-containing monooxygenase 5 [Biomphalaria glabrata]|uniref:Flavin-containing monooxygenase n=1 Tax=Biomphalaria glabrata TaxID=6526 RepID=A0A9W2YK11_BIOGL|nr:flavin-containing monooxygenase 5 [Biomphalaria glabrata]XP_055863036.1 flavin-containing monooxygenase 5 [Biomphalaria glabrata]XP_055863037.1 flavin-containing monooxygenase 5 [Biomphalaria glabrata]